MNAIDAMRKLAVVADIFEAAKVLQRNNLLGNKDAAAVVREYMAAHPEINEVLNQDKPND